MGEEVTKISAEEIKNALLKQKDVFKRLEDFMKVAEDYNEVSCKQDIVHEYLQISGNCSNLLDLLKNIRNMHSAHVSILFRVLKIMLARISHDLKLYSSVGSSIVVEILKYGMSTVLNMLKPKEKSVRIKLALSLLISMVKQGLEAARNVFNKFQISSQNVAHLFNRRNAMDEEDVRTCFLHLIVTFLNTGDSTFVRQIVDIKGFLNGLFPGLEADRAAVIHFVLRSFQSKVVENSAISKTSKIRLFNDFTLKFVLQLYSWKGPKRCKNPVKRKRGDEGEFEPLPASEEDITLVKNTTHQFMISLCCSYKNGVIFRDPTLGTSGRNQNHIITNLLQSFQSPYANTHMAEFVVMVLKTCPDQLKFYLPTLNEFLIPRLSLSWLQTIDLLKKIVAAQDPISCIMKCGDKKPVNKLITMATIVCIPPGINGSMIIQALKSDHHYICYNLLDYLLCVLKQVNEVGNFCKCPNSDVLYSQVELTTFHHSLVEAVMKKFSVINSLQGYWKRVVNDMDFSTEATLIEMTDCPPLALSECLSKILEVFKVYQEMAPNHIQDSSFNFSDLFIRKDTSIKRISQEYCSLQLQILDLVASQEHAENILLNKDTEESPLFLLLDVFLATDNLDLMHNTLKLIYKLLRKLNIFHHCEWEIEIWLKEMKNVKRKYYPSLINFMDMVFKSVLEKPNKFMDEILECITEASIQEGQEVLAASVILDKMLEDEYAMRTDSGSLETIQNDRQLLTAFYWQQSFSLVVPGALSCLNSLPDNSTKVGKQYVGCVLRHIMHHQHDPEALFVLAKKHEDVLPSKLFNYWELLLSVRRKQEVTGVDIQEKDSDSLSISDQLQDIFVSVYTNKLSQKSNNTIAVNHLELTHKMQEIKAEEIPGLVWQILSYLNVGANSFAESKTTVLIFHEYIALLETLITKYFQESNTVTNIENNGEQHTYNWFQAVSSSRSSIIKDILFHPIILDWFLKTEWLMRKKKFEKFVKSMTKFVLCIIRNSCVNNLSALKIEKFIIPYKDKVMNFCKNHIILPLKEGREDSFEKFNLEEVIQPFHNVFLANDIIILLELLSSLNNEQMQVVDPNFKVMSSLLEIYISGNEFILSPYFIRTLFSSMIYLKMENCEKDLEEKLLCLFKMHPIYVHALDSDIYLPLLHNPTFKQLKILDILICESPAHRLNIKRALTSNINSFKGWNPEFVIYLLNKCIKTSSCANKEEDKFAQIVASPYWKALSKILKHNPSLEMELCADDVKNTLETLIFESYLDAKKITKFFGKIYEEVIKVVPSLVKMDIIIQLLECLQKAEESVLSTSPNVILLRVILHWIIDMSPDTQNVKNFNFNKMLSKITELSKKMGVIAVQEAIAQDQLWSIFMHHVLKFALKDNSNGSNMLSTARTLCEIIYKSSYTETIKVNDIFSYLIGHSNFFNVMLDDTPHYSALKDAVVDMLITIVHLEKEVCQSNHIPLLLASYHATLSLTDQKLLYLIKLYEDNGIDMQNFSPLLWGKSAITHYSVKKDVKLFLWKQPKMGEVLNLFQSEKVQLTALNFPLNLKLEPVFPPVSNKSEKFCKDNIWLQLYDPRFFLPLLSKLLSPGSYVHCYYFLNSNILSLIFASLSSHEPSIRAIGYYCLSQFYYHLESSGYRDGILWTTFLDAMRNSIESQNARLPSIITMFLAKVSLILLKPGDPLYTPIFKFLMIKPMLDLGHVPEFYTFFNSNDIQHRLHRSWILALIGEGMRTSLDFHLCEKRYIFTILLPFYCSPVCIQQEKVKILQILEAVMTIYSSARNLCQSGFLVWLHSIIKESEGDDDGETLKSINKLMCILWKTYKVTYENRELDIDISVNDFSQEPSDIATSGKQKSENSVCDTSNDQACIKNWKSQVMYSSFPSEFLLVHLALMQKLRSLDSESIYFYLQTLLDTITLQKSITSQEDATSVINNNHPSIAFCHVLQLSDTWETFTKENMHENELANSEEDIKRNCSHIQNADSFDNIQLFENNKIRNYNAKCQKLIAETILFWKPSLGKINDSQYDSFVSHLLDIIFLMLKNTNDHIFSAALSNWLWCSLMEDKKKGLIKAFLSSKGKGKVCFDLLLHHFERTLKYETIKSETNGADNSSITENVPVFRINSASNSSYHWTNIFEYLIQESQSCSTSEYNFEQYKMMYRMLIKEKIELECNS